MTKDLVPVGQVNTERFHNLYLINAGWLVKVMLTMMKPFIPENSRDKIMLVSLQELSQHIDID